MISVILRKKVLIPRHSEFRGTANSEARNGTEQNGIPRKNQVLGNSHRTASMITLTSNTIIEILGCRVLCWTGFSSGEWFGTELRQFASIFFPRIGIPKLFSLPLKDSEGNSESILLFLYPRKGILSCFLFHWSVRKGIPRVSFYFCSTERNSELFSLPRKVSERNSEVFCSAEQPEFRRK